MKALILTIQDFQDIELVTFSSVLKASGQFECDFYSCQKQTEVIGQYKIATIKTIINYDVNDYDLLYVPGGVGALHLRKLEAGIACVRDFLEHDKYVVAICDAPNAIAESNILKQHHRFVSWSDGSRNHANRIKDIDIQIHQTEKFITGRCSLTTMDLAFYTIKVLFGSSFCQDLKTKLTGIA